MPMSNDWFYDYFINEVKAIRRNSIPKPLTYDYMPEGYPEKNIQTVTLMEEQEVDFSIRTGELVGAYSPVQFVPVLGQTYTISFDGVEYECEAKSPEAGWVYFGNLHIMMPSKEDTGEPFIYTNEGSWLWMGSSGTIEMGNHTIGVTNVTETITPMAEEFLPNITTGEITTLHINITAINAETMEATFTADKTPAEMQQASVNGPTWCVVTFEAGTMDDSAVSIGLPPAWAGGDMAFGLLIATVHEDGGNNKMAYAVKRGSSSTWTLDLSVFGS